MSGSDEQTGKFRVDGFPCDEPWRAMAETLGLTSDESPVVRLLLAGHPHAVVAERLALSIDGIDVILQRLYHRLGVAGWSGLLARVYQAHDARLARLPNAPGCPLVRLALSDEELMLALGKGHRNALGLLATRYGDWMRAKALRLLGDRALAEDVAQQALFWLMQHPRNYRGEAKFSTYLFRMIARLCRNSHHRPQPHDPDALAEYEDHRPGPDKIAASAEEILRIRRAITSLPERQRTAFELKSAGCSRTKPSQRPLELRQGAPNALWRVPAPRCGAHSLAGGRGRILVK
ncbi:MAG: RNA polymerase sigma factor [Thermoguttaceae bacterium]